MVWRPPRPCPHRADPGGRASQHHLRPVTAGLASQLDWRATYLVLAGLLAVVTVPAHLLGLQLPWPPPPSQSGSVVHAPRRVLRSRAFTTLVVSFGLTSLTSYVVVVNLVPLLGERGIGPGTAAMVLGVGGVGQVLGRLVYAPLARRLGVRVRTLLVLGTVAVTTGLLGVVTWLPALVAVAVLAGMAAVGLAAAALSLGSVPPLQLGRTLDR